MLDATRCGPAGAVGELRSIATRLHIAADTLDGTLQRGTGDESHLLILSRLPVEEIRDRLQAAHSDIEATPVRDGIQCELHGSRAADGTTASLAAALRGIADELAAGAERLAG